LKEGKMAFDGLSWYRLNRPVTELEEAARLPISQRCSDAAKDGGTVFSVSESCLEISDDSYWDKGRGVLAFLLPGTGSFVATGFILWMMTHLPPIYEQRGEVELMRGILTFFLIFMLALCAVGVWALSRDCFRYTHRPIRFNRANRTVYVFRHNGPGGVLSVPWDEAFFYVERKARTGIPRTARRLIRCLVLADDGRVINTFSVGKHLVLAFDEDTAPGRLLIDELHRNFEFYRRFMEEGLPSVPPVAEFLGKEVSFRNSLRTQFGDISDVAHSRHPVVWLLFAVTALPTFIQSILHYVAQLTCREPVWPEDVERACTGSLKQTEGAAL
jgi:hypothetical protein